MRSALIDVFTDFTIGFEGYTDYMCCDTRGLVTTGIGNLIDPISTAYPLPWKRPDGSLASRDEVTAAWNLVKSRTDLAPKSGYAYKGLTDLHLTKEDINALVLQRFQQNDGILRKRFRTFDDWPADGQLGVHSMAWAAGAAFRAPKFDAAANSTPPDFLTMAAECHLAGNNRNVANKQLFENAAHVLQNGLDFETLFYRVGKQGIAAVSTTALSAVKIVNENRATSGIAVLAATASAGYFAYLMLSKKAGDS